MRKSIWILAIVLFFSQGCVTGRVSTANYSEFPPNQTFALYGGDKSFTLTEKKIQNYISEHLKSRGFIHEEDVEKAKYVVVYSYEIGEGKTIVSSTPDHVYGGQKVTSRTKYPRYFQISIIDAEATKETQKPVFVWQGEVYSSGSSSNIKNLAKAFIDQIFLSFGQTVDDKIFVVPKSD